MLQPEMPRVIIQIEFPLHGTRSAMMVEGQEGLIRHGRFAGRPGRAISGWERWMGLCAFNQASTILSRGRQSMKRLTYYSAFSR